MLMPSIFRDNLLDDFFDYPFHGAHDYGMNELMKTDVKETEQGYEMTMNLPGIRKENVQAELKDGYLTIKASSNSENDAKDKEGKYIRRERYSGTCCRSFYVGEAVKQEDIRAKFEDGTLKLFIPRQDAKAVEDDRKYIAIEG